MFFKNDQGDYVSLTGIDRIGVGRRDVPEAIDEPGGTWWDVFVDTNGPGNRIGSYRDEKKAREVARAVADAEGYSGVYEIDDDDTVSDAANVTTSTD